jgi:hypothetical protein
MNSLPVKLLVWWVVFLTAAVALSFHANTIAIPLFAMSQMLRTGIRDRAFYPWERAVGYALLGMVVLFLAYLMWRGNQPFPAWAIVWWKPVAVVVAIPLLAYAAWQDYLLFKKPRIPRTV